MKEERLQILKMVEDGKISAEDAVKLLDAVRTNAQYEQPCQEGPSFEDRVKEFSRNAETFAKDLSGKMGALYKDMEPKLRKATKVVVEKTAGVVDEISKALNESLNNLEKEKCCDDNCCDDECSDDDCCEDEKCCCAEEEKPVDKPVDNDGNPIE